jgi:hypothetical protein
VDHAAASKELILALRGQRSQVGLSRRLGYTSNVLYTWEHGRRAPVASAFFRLAARVGVDVNAGLRQFLADRRAALSDVRRPTGVGELVRALMADWPIVELAESIEADRTTVGRWVSGATEPKLPELLRIVETTTQRLLDFVALFVDPESLPSTSGPYRDLQVQRRLAYDMPWSHGVLRALELEQYRSLPRHEPGFIAAELGISLDEERRCLHELSRAGQIRLQRGRWVLGRVLTVDTRPSEADNRRLKLHFAEAAVARLRDGSAPPSALFSFNLFAINAADFEKIHRLHVEYYQRVRELIAASVSPDRVVLMNLQLCPLSAGELAAEAADSVAK